MMRTILLTASLLALSAPALAGTPIDERRALKADARLHVSNVAGSIEISAWEKNEVHVTGELGEGAEALLIEGDASRLSIEVKTPKKSRSVEDSYLRIFVPAGVELNVEAVSADVAVQGVQGRVAASSVSGDVNLSLKSAEVEARTVSGDLDLRAPARTAAVNSISGDVRASGLSGKLKLETVSGGVELVGGPFSDMELKSISGDFDLDVNLTPEGRLVGETLSGQMRARLPNASSAMVTLRSFSGEVRSDFGGQAGGDDDRRERLEFKLGDGRARIDLSSFSGDISLQKR